MAGKRNGIAREAYGASQVDVQQKRERARSAPHLNCAVCNSELEALSAMKAEAGDQVVYFCNLHCFGKWEHARAGR